MACPSSSSNAKLSIRLNFKSCDKEDIISKREDMIGRLRFCSIPLKDGDCFYLKEGEKVLAMNNVQSGSLCFDAVIEKVYKVRHSGRLPCRCTFKVKWLTTMVKGITTTVPSKSIMKLSDKNIDGHPVIAAFLASSENLNHVLVPPFVGSLEETSSEANAQVELEKQVEDISKLADKSECSKGLTLEFIQANFFRQETVPPKSQNVTRRITRNQTKEQANVGLVKHFGNAPLLSPLAARAALASLLHGQVVDEKEPSFFWSQDHLLDLPLEDEKKHSVEKYQEVQVGAIQIEAHVNSDVMELPNLVKESREAIQLEDWDVKSSINACRKGAKRSLFGDSPDSVTSLKKSVRASKEEGNINYSTEMATKEKLNHGIPKRLTRSSAKNQILESIDKEPSNEHSRQVSTRVTRSGQRIAREVIHIDLSFGDESHIKGTEDHDAPSKKDENNKKEFASATITVSTDREPQIKKGTRKSNGDAIEEDQGAISQAGEKPRAKKNKLCSEKPILRFSPRLKSLQEPSQKN
ncbi:hypothetical protein Cni_G17193 [Canna indica]|uniref:SAWADEE domain-containing protein n=1 Tax=Canna indica TaxID=4628 RepID=A0AAQ3KGH9_9LILI|nr:hypothetical protein Cni_G17193 [Canna indica]